MQFFQNQQRARQRTLLLVALFVLAVVAITLAVEGVFYLILTAQGSTALPFHHWLLTSQSLICSATVLGIIATGSLIRHASLRGGGEALAKLAGGRKLDLNSTDPLEKRLRNVVEEMAIASGVVMPELFVLDQENAINAFVAGYQPNEAVVVVTRGALEALTRDELQGVMAHEFSHLLNGDMHLNSRLVAILSGILLLGEIGGFMMRSFGRYRSRGRDGRAAGALVVVGLALTIIGYIGVFFGRLIKAAVSRQREFLADASAVQFTRQNDGIGGALYKIGLGQFGSQLRHTLQAEELNHMCLGESIPPSWGGLLASHPPIERRLDAIDGTLKARLQARYGRDGNRLGHSLGQADTEKRGPSPAIDELKLGFNTLATRADRPLAPRTLAQATGSSCTQNEDYAKGLLAALPPVVIKALHSSELAVQFCYALVDSDRETTSELHPNKAGAWSPQGLTIDVLRKELEELGPAFTLPCLELTVPALRRLGAEDRRRFLAELEARVKSDGRVRLSEWVILSFLQRHLTQHTPKGLRSHYKSYDEVAEALEGLLALMVSLATREAAERQTLYQNALSSFFKTREQSPLACPAGAKALYHGLNKLARLSPLLKPAIINACADCVIHDGKVSVREYELMRLIADQLDCPLPPLPSAI